MEEFGAKFSGRHDTCQTKQAEATALVILPVNSYDNVLRTATETNNFAAGRIASKT